MLTDAKIAGLKGKPGERLEVRDTLVPGLRVRVGASGAKAFTLRTRIAGRPVNVTLGRYPDMTLAKARDAARALLVEIKAGRDPVARRAVAGKVGGLSNAGTLAFWWERYLDRSVRGRLRSAREVERLGAKWIVPALGHRRIETITRADISRLVDAVAYPAGGKPRAREGRHVHQQLSAFFSWVLPMIDGLPSNPCRDALRPKAGPPRERVLDEAEIGALWRVCGDLGWPWGSAVRLLLLTGLRRGEVFGARWEEFEGNTWLIPGARTKNGRAHFVPLSRPALEILEALPRLEGPLLFPATRLVRAGERRDPERPVSGFSKAGARLVARVADEVGRPLEPFTLHDIRRTVATGLQRIGVALPVVEAVLNHVSGTRAGIVGVYQRHDFAAERRQALEAWAAEIERLAHGPASDRVVPLRGGRA
ncbi:MAG: site-specific integrase [Sphingomonadaceae bacterium]